VALCVSALGTFEDPLYDDPDIAPSFGKPQASLSAIRNAILALKKAANNKLLSKESATDILAKTGHLEEGASGATPVQPGDKSMTGWQDGVKDEDEEDVWDVDTVIAKAWGQ